MIITNTHNNVGLTVPFDSNSLWFIQGFAGSNSHKSPSFDLESSYISISSVDDLWRNSTTETDVFSNDQFNSYEDSFAGFSTVSAYIMTLNIQHIWVHFEHIWVHFDLLFS